MKLSSFAALIIRLIGLGVVLMGIFTFVMLASTMQFRSQLGAPPQFQTDPQFSAFRVEMISYSQIGIIGTIEILVGLGLVFGSKPIGRILCKGLDDAS